MKWRTILLPLGAEDEAEVGLEVGQERLQQHPEEGEERPQLQVRALPGGRQQLLGGPLSQRYSSHSLGALPEAQLVQARVRLQPLRDRTGSKCSSPTVISSCPVLKQTKNVIKRVEFVHSSS